MASLDSVVIIKDELYASEDERPSPDKRLAYAEYAVPSTVEGYYEFTGRSFEVCERLFGEKGQHIAMALNESLQNAICHGCHFVEGKKVLVQLCRDGYRGLVTVTNDGDGFDPTVLLNRQFAEDLKQTRGRGFEFFIKGLSDLVAYDPDGRGMYLGFNLLQ